MSLFHVVHAEMIQDLEQGYHSWLRQTNREREQWSVEELLEDNNSTRLYFLECVGFIKQPKRTIWKRFFDMVSDR